MRILIFHGYLLRGTGSNIYNTSLCRALAGMGHEVHICCQERHPEDVGLPEGVTVHNPDIGRVLPVYVADEYEGFDAVPFPELSDADLDHYLEANVEAVAAVADEVAPDVALANHLIMGPVVMARAVGGRVPYAVKVHGSALEYTVRPHRERFLPYAQEGLAGASAVLVGSRHTAESLWEVMDDPELPSRTRLGPPGVEVESFRPRPAPEAAAGVRDLADRLEGGQADWGGEPGAADALRALDPEHERVVSYVGKLIVSKGVDLLLAAWPLVVARVPDARLVVVGFGTYRGALHGMVDALAEGDLGAVREIAARGRELEGGPSGELTYLAAFLDGMGDQEARDYAAAAPAAAARVAFTGRLEHDDLPALLPACQAQVVPSTFPEAFGMVAAEAASCGALPLSAAHSGLAEVTAVLAAGVDPGDAALLSFERGPDAVAQIAERLVTWLTRDPEERARVREKLAHVARGRFGWEAVAEGVIAAARGELDDLPVPGATPGAE
jgi:glycosyltransferase involved in cell wall biosynthesis